MTTDDTRRSLGLETSSQRSQRLAQELLGSILEELHQCDFLRSLSLRNQSGWRYVYGEKRVEQYSLLLKVDIKGVVVNGYEIEIPTFIASKDV